MELSKKIFFQIFIIKAVNMLIFFIYAPKIFNRFGS